MIDIFPAEAWCESCDATTTQSIFTYDDGNEIKECGICGNQEIYDDESWDADDDYPYEDLADHHDRDYEEYEALWDRDGGGWD